MKDDLIQVYQYLNNISVVGQQNVVNMANAIIIIQNIIQHISQEEQRNIQENSGINGKCAKKEEK